MPVALVGCATRQPSDPFCEQGAVWTGTRAVRARAPLQPNACGRCAAKWVRAPDPAYLARRASASRRRRNGRVQSRAGCERRSRDLAREHVGRLSRALSRRWGEIPCAQVHAYATQGVKQEEDGKDRDPGQQPGPLSIWQVDEVPPQPAHRCSITPFSGTGA